MSPEATARLRAIRDCGVLRVGPRYIGMAELSQGGLVTYSPAKEIVGRFDVRLTDYGRALAKKLPSGMVFHWR